MISSGADMGLMWTVGRVHPLCVPSFGTNAGTPRVAGPKRVPGDTSLLVNTRGLAAERERTRSGQVIESVPSEGLGTAGGDRTVHGHSCRRPTAIDTVEDE